MLVYVYVRREVSMLVYVCENKRERENAGLCVWEKRERENLGLCVCVKKKESMCGLCV